MNLRPLFEPENIAVIGLSLSNDRHPANVIFNKNLHRYPVNIYAINPKGGFYHDEKVFESIDRPNVRIDLAVIATRAELVPAVVEECIDAGVSAATIISGGFAEVGNRSLQDRVTAIARKAGFPFVGPNCLGIYMPARFDSFFLPVERMVRPEPGGIAFVSQSGGILVDQMIKFSSEGVGLSSAVSIGNKALLKEIELLDYFSRHDPTKVIVFYVEGFGKNEGREFVLAARNCSKPVIVLKAGKSPGGTRAVSSHTASIAGDYESFSSALRQHGILEATNEFELISFCESLSYYRRGMGKNIGIVTGSGGHGAVSVDICDSNGFTVPQLSKSVMDSIRTSLSKSIRGIASLNNPLDLTGSSTDDDFVSCTRHLSRLPDIDCIIMLLLPYIPGISSDLGAKLSAIYKQEGKPLLAYVPRVEKYGMLIEGFQLNGIPVSPSIEGAILMARALREA